MSTDVELGAVATLAAAVVTVVWQPWTNDAKERRRDRKLIKLFNLGAPAVKGIFDEVLSAPERMRDAEELLKSHQEWIEHAEHLREANNARWIQNDETLRKIHNAITNLTREFVNFRDENKRNGGDGPGFGDSLQRIEKGLGVSVPRQEPSDEAQ